MAVVEDVLATRLDLLGLSGYVSGIQQAGSALNLFGGEMSAAQSKALGFGIAAGAAGAGALAFFGRAALAAGEDAATFARAAANFKGSFPADELAAFTGDLEKATGVADDSIAGFLGLLGTFQITGSAAKGLAEPILNAAEALKAQGVSVEQLAVQIGKAAQTGDVGALRRVGIIIDDVGFKSLDTAGRVDALGKALNAQGGATAARDALNTLPGSLRAASVAFGSLQEALGAPLIGPLTGAAKLATDLAHGFTALPGPVQTCVTLVGVGLAGALAVYSVQTAIAVAQTVRLAQAQLQVAASARQMTGALPGAASSKGAGGFKTAAAVGIADLALQFLPDDFAGGAGRGLKSIGNAAAAGAGIGGFFGPQGAAIGGLLGAGAGAVGNLIGGGAGASSPAKAAQDKQTDLLQKIADNTDPKNLPLDTSRLAGARQVGAMSLARSLA